VARPELLEQFEVAAQMVRGQEMAAHAGVCRRPDSPRSLRIGKQGGHRRSELG
jgi:hypothetical protein